MYGHYGGGVYGHYGWGSVWSLWWGECMVTMVGIVNGTYGGGSALTVIFVS